ncbi:Multidrug/Oligosaccharidyl-lipid/Polysaccharide (MOP) Flippase Superfamily [Phytophthora palmivora]|uniref:Multidrug/Oligosaccharidyl-lipid/Polysaccharide (MOP) Flippase Superfamily n=1 Tax=Phytophthora palmivora TaxID=4796 RepID=A0A2P4YBR9_9STRA|nr:Multidrug/Oligosaccharidyl-lipid/Polysaccharide (MOP) Flippase Superfamily [Phytophthora palmivora]
MTASILPKAVMRVSANPVLVNINNTIYMTFAGLAVASNIRVGNCLGANAPKQARVACTVSLTLTLAISATFAITLYCTSCKCLQRLGREKRKAAREKKAAESVNVAEPAIEDQPAAEPEAKQAPVVSGETGLWLGFGFGIFVAASLQFYMLFERWTWVELADEAQKRTAE